MNIFKLHCSAQFCVSLAYAHLVFLPIRVLICTQNMRKNRKFTAFYDLIRKGVIKLFINRLEAFFPKKISRQFSLMFFSLLLFSSFPNVLSKNVLHN